MKLTRNRNPQGRRIRTIGVGMFGVQSSAPAGTTPADLSNVVLWLEAAAGTVRNAADGTGSAMSDAETVGRWIRPGDSLTSPAFVYATQTTVDDKPPLDITASRYTIEGGSSDVLALSSAVALTGDFVIWAVSKGSPDEEEYRTILLAGEATASVLRVQYSVAASELAIRTDDDEGVSYEFPAASGLALIRVRRAAGVVYMAASGAAEEEAGELAGTMTFDRILKWVFGVGATQAGYGTGAILISTNAGHAANPPSYIDGPAGYFATSTANVAAAWGVSI